MKLENNNNSSKEKVYVLQHIYEYGEDDEYVEEKMLGVYSSEEKASEAIERYIQLEGFKDYPRECFYISEYFVDKDSWRGGFVSGETIIQEFEEFTACLNQWIGININPRASWEDNEYYQVLCQIDEKRYKTNDVTELADFIQQIWEQGRNPEDRDYKHFKTDDNLEFLSQIPQIWERRFDYGIKEKKDYISIAEDIIKMKV